MQLLKSKWVHYPLRQMTLAGLISSNSGYVSYRLMTTMIQHFFFPLLLPNLNFLPSPPSSDSDDHDSDDDLGVSSLQDYISLHLCMWSFCQTNLGLLHDRFPHCLLFIYGWSRAIWVQLIKRQSWHHLRSISCRNTQRTVLQ